MRPRLVRTTALALALVAGLAACSSSSGSSSSGSGATSTAAATAGTEGPVTVASSSATTAPAASTGTAAAGECAVLLEAVTEMAGTWQAYVQFASIPDVARWKTLIEPMGLKHTFTQTLDTLSSAFGSDKEAADAIAYMRTAEAIVQKGLGGQTAAVDELKAVIGPNIMEALLKQAPISKAFGTKGC